LKENLYAFGEADPLMAVVMDAAGRNIAKAMMTPPFPMIVNSDPVDETALKALGDALISENWHLPGVNGVAEVSDRFADIWQSRTSQTARLQMRLRAYELKEVTEVGYPDGQMRIAVEGDAQQAVDLLNAMRVELNLQGRRATVESVLEIIRMERVFFWETAGKVVTVTIANRPQIKGICISGVYTPPEHRRKGYARALVAEASKEMLSRGFEITNLFTDLANPTSNKIYQEVGYKPVCDYHQYSFE
jgi:predicted GNAT family acetyltransferase